MLIIPFVVSGIRTLKDRTLAVTFNTQELPPDKVAAIFEFQNKMGFAALKAEEFTAEELHDMDEVNMDLDLGKGKSRSERLRNTLYVLWKKTAVGSESFDAFYIRNMEILIDHFKSKIPSE
jgi:hypothetical protein